MGSHSSPGRSPVKSGSPESRNASYSTRPRAAPGGAAGSSMSMTRGRAPGGSKASAAATVAENSRSASSTRASAWREDVGDSFRVQPGVQRAQHGAGHGDGVVRLEQRRDVGRHHRHHVAARRRRGGPAPRRSGGSARRSPPRSCGVRPVHHRKSSAMHRLGASQEAQRRQRERSWRRSWRRAAWLESEHVVEREAALAVHQPMIAEQPAGRVTNHDIAACAQPGRSAPGRTPRPGTPLPSRSRRWPAAAPRSPTPAASCSCSTVVENGAQAAEAA